MYEAFKGLPERLQKQLQFLMEIDKVKGIFRRTRLFDHSRYENDAEHGWHMSMMALVLCEHANHKDIDISKVVKMALVHDLVEIDAGDTFLYADNRDSKYKAERECANRIFGMLPEDQRDEFIALWEEFEKKETPEAKFAGSLDRLGPIVQNYLDNGHAWKKHGITSDKVLAVNSRIAKGSEEIWAFARAMIKDAVEKGDLKVSK